MGKIEKTFCQERLGDVAGTAAMDLVERATGLPCPCKQGKGCPLNPATVVATTASVA